ncbi:MAG: methylmalonyl-CoA mutase, partial [Acidobacteriaceae bacterium]|nr:methylmalonyl-CoA mutase [Acidobacteriaceae bacterium]
KGFIQSEIQNAAYQSQKAIEEGRQIVVGVNKFRTEEAEPLHTFRLDPALERQQVERLRSVRASRSAEAACRAVANLDQAARGNENLMPKILECCRAYVTIGEISDALRGVYGEYRETF